MPEPPSHSPPPTPPDVEPRPSAADEQARGSLFGGLMRHLSHAGREMLSVVAGKYLADRPDSSQTSGRAAPDDPAAAGLQKRVTVLHEVAERLRGAADDYIAAKLDEMEARVDAKLDHIEQRVDDKLVALHQQLAEMRDRELRHRLRLLKITLIFTVLVAILSLGYKWLARFWS